MSTRKKKIKLSCHCYCIYNKDKPERLEEMQDVMSSIKFKSRVVVEAIDAKTGNHSIDVARSHIKALEEAIKAEAFPLLLFEDDAALNVDYFDDIKLPPAGCFIIYLGSSLLDGGSFSGLRIENYSKDYFRLYGAAANHAVYIPNIENGKSLKRIYEYALSKKDGIDDVLAKEFSNKLVMVTPKDGPYFHQRSPQSAYEQTHFLWKDHLRLLRKKEL